MSNQLPQMPIRAKYADKTAEGVNIDETIATMQGELVKCVKVLDLGYNDIDDMTSDEIANFVAGDYGIIKCTDNSDGFIAYYVLDIKYDEHCELHLLDSEFDELYKAILLKEGDTWSVEKSTTELASIENAGTKLYKHYITFSGGSPYNLYSIIIINTSQEKVNNLSALYTSIFNDNTISIYVKGGGTYYTLYRSSNSTTSNKVILPYSVYMTWSYPGGDIGFAIYSLGSTLSTNGSTITITNNPTSLNISSSTTITDTVTPL